MYEYIIIIIICVIMEIQVFGKISNFNEITNIAIKKIIINIIYDQLNLSNFKYQLLDDCNDLNILKKELLYVTPHIMGVNCLIVFIEHEQKKYQAILNKKDLKFNKNHVNISQIKIYNMWFNHNNKYKSDENSNINYNLYPLTIFDGKFIMAENNLTYLIHDAYFLAGHKMFTKNLINKMKLINEYMAYINQNIENTLFDIRMTAFYNIEQIGDLIFNKIKNSKLKINGLIFYPERSGKYYIFINDVEFFKLRSSVSDDIIIQNYNSLSIPAIPINFSINNQIDNNLTNDFIMKKTDISDVFELYHCNNLDKLYINITPENRIGIAHIPNIKTSQYCKSLSNKNDIFIQKCIFNNKFKKWMPVVP